MPQSAARIARLLATALVVALVAAVLGAGAGFALSEAGGGGDSSVPDLTNPAPATEGALATATQDDASQPGDAAVSVAVQSARIVPAATAAGRERQRLSIRVTVTVGNSGSDELALEPIALESGPVSVRNDPSAGAAAGDLLEPLAPGARASGELRFETAGTQSARFTEGSQATLRIGGRATQVGLELGADAP
jgi:hypothetical protein